MEIELPGDALVVLVGAAGCGKSTFAARHFLPTQVVASDACRAMVADDEANAAASKDAFTLMHLVIEFRLKRGRLAVADATNVRSEKREELLVLARRWKRPAVAIVLDLPEPVCQQRNIARRRMIPPPAIGAQVRDLRRSLPLLEGEGFERVWLLRTAEEVESVTVTAGGRGGRV
jgi:predicted kinase